MKLRILCLTGWSVLFLPLFLAAQDRDVRAEHLVLDDDGGGGGTNTMTIRPPSTLTQDVILTIPQPTGGTAEFLLAPPGSAGAWLRGGNAGTNPAVDYLGTSNGVDFVIGTNGSERLRVEADGDVGIGTSGPSARLDLVQTGSQPVLETRGGSVLFDGNTGTTPVSGAGTRLMWIPGKSAFRAGYVPGSEWNDTNIGQYSVGLGYAAQASGQFSVSLSGTATGSEAIAVGYATSSGTSSVAIGGNNTTASGFISVCLGSGSLASGGYSTVIGRENTAAGTYASVIGGYGMTLDAGAARSFGFLGGNNGSNPMTISTPDVAVFGNTDLWLANNDNGASRLLFYEPNSTTGAFPGTANYTALRAGAQTGNIEYVLPATAPTAGQVLSASTVTPGTPTVVTLSWISAVTGTASDGGPVPTSIGEVDGGETGRIGMLMELVEKQGREIEALRLEVERLKKGGTAPAESMQIHRTEEMRGVE